MLKRLLSSVLVCSMMLSGIAGAEASAVSEAESSVRDVPANNIILIEPEIIELNEEIEHDPNDNVFYISPDQIIRPLSLFSGNTRNFYDLLTANEKLAYDMMKTAIESDHTTQIIAMTGFSDFDALKRAYCAFISDHPEIFWLHGLYFSYYDNDGVISEIDIVLDKGYCAGYNESNIESRYNALMTKVRQIVSNAGQYTTDYEKIKYFAEYISDNMTYNDAAAASGNPQMSKYANCWNAYGALIEGNGVCEAYAEAFKLLCDEAGIPCISVYSYDHEWNAVKLDGSWYYVDVTWIDTGNKSTYQYDKWLAVGTVSAAKNDNSIASHTQNPNSILSGFSANLTYPDISTKDYEPAADPYAGTDTGSGDGNDQGQTGTDTGGSGSGDNDDPGSAGSGSTGSGSSGSGGSSVNEKNKSISSAGSASYKTTAALVNPVINVALPSNLSAVINPYGVSVSDRTGSYGSDGVVSPVYTIRNKTQTSAVAVKAEAYLTVPKDKSSGEPTITVCENPNEVKSKSGKAFAAYLLASVSGEGAVSEASENENLIEANKVKFEAGKTIVFADATLDSKNTNKDTLMVIPKADYEGNSLKDYYYGHFQISGESTDMLTANWSSSDKINLVVVFNIVPCPDP